MKCIQCKREIDLGVTGMAFVDAGMPLHPRCEANYVRRVQQIDRLKQMVKPLIDEVNAGSPQDLAEAIVAALVSNHRTLQRAFLGAVKLAITKYAELDAGMYTDLRNAAAHEWAQAAEIPNSEER